jgi:hypothetical protein
MKKIRNLVSIFLGLDFNMAKQINSTIFSNLKKRIKIYATQFLLYYLKNNKIQIPSNKKPLMI